MAAVSVTANNVVPSANARYVENPDRSRTKAAVAVTAGLIAYRLADSTYGIAVTTSADPVNKPVGVFVNSAGAGQPVDIVWDDPLLTISGSTFTAGIVYILGTAGGIAPAADATTGWTTTPVAVGLTATTLCWHTPMGNLADPMTVPGGSHA